VTPSLTVDADLVVERDGHTYRVWNQGDRLVLGVPSLSALRELDDVGAALPVDPATLGSGLATAGLTVEVQVRRARVASLGAGVVGGPLGQWLTGTDAAVDLAGVATAAVRALG